MSDRPKTSALATSVGISPSYASAILTGSRVPPLGLAIRIFRETGYRSGLLTSATIEEIDTLEKLVAAQADVAATDAEAA